jgi:hypothetical protein
MSDIVPKDKDGAEAAAIVGGTAATGAAIGGMIGGPVGAVVGGFIGVVAGGAAVLAQEGRKG